MDTVHQSMLCALCEDHGFDLITRLSSQVLRFVCAQNGLLFDITAADSGYLLVAHADGVEQLYRCANDNALVGLLKKWALQPPPAAQSEQNDPVRPGVDRFLEFNVPTLPSMTPLLVEQTEIRAEILRRKGQEQLRTRLLARYGQCQVTGLKKPALLVASHIKPWAVASDEERLDVENAFLLARNVDAAFDQGLISFDDSGQMLFSRGFSLFDQHALGLHDRMRLCGLTDQNRSYLQYHRLKVFKDA